MRFLSIKKCMFFLLILMWSFLVSASPEKLSIYKPVHFGNLEKIVIHQNYAIVLTRDKTLCVYSIEDDKFTLVNYKILKGLGEYPVTSPVICQNYLYLGCWDYIAIFDISSLPEIKFVKTLENIDGIYTLATYNNILAVGKYNNASITFYSLDDPSNPVELSEFSISGQSGVFYIHFTGSIVIYATKWPSKIYVLDISNPQNPQELKEYELENSLMRTWLMDGRYFFILTSGPITYLIDVSDPQNLPDPVETNINFTWDAMFSAENNLVAFYSMVAAVMDKSQISQPDNMQFTTYSIPHYVIDCSVINKGNGIYNIYSFDSNDYKTILSFDDQTSEITEIYTDHTDFESSGTIEKIEDYIYTPTSGNGIGIYKLDSRGIPQLVKFDKCDNHIPQPYGIYSFTRQTTKGESTYLAMPTSSSIFIVNIDDRENPQIVKEISFQAKTLIVNGNYLYGIDYRKIGIFDISDLNNPQTLSELELPSTEKASAYYYQNHLYVGKYIIDVSDKANPEIVSDSFSAYYVCGIGDLLIVSPSDYKVVKVYKLNDPENPEEIQTLSLKQNIYGVYNLFQKDGKICLTHKCSNTYIYSTIIFSLQGETLVEEYQFDGSISGLATGEKFFYATQKFNTPFVVLGKNYIIPHIATTWGWETYLIVDNLSSETENFIYSLNDYVKGEYYEEEIEGGKQIALPLTFGQTGDIVVPFDSHLSFKVSYHHTGEHGIAEFLLDTHISQTLNFYTPQYLADNLTWMGIAASNEGSRRDYLTLYTYNNSGEFLKGTQLAQQYPFTRYASVLSNLFSTIEWTDIARVKSETDFFASGITISGNGNSRLLFTPATYEKQRSDTRYIPHIDVKGYWNTYLIFDNPTDSDITVNIKLYSNGSVTQTDTKTIPANSNLTVLINDYNNEDIDCGEISGCGSDLIVRLAYMFKNTGATAEFLIDGDNIGSYLAFDLPAYRADVLTWWGLALMNPDGDAKDITLTAYADGQAIDTAIIHIDGHSKIAALLEDLFENLNGQTVERVVAETPSGYILGLNICGSNQDRYLFTPAITNY